jgi:hypothetical protein
MKISQFFLVSAIIFLGFLLRFYRFDGPVADWHSWRQADTSAVSRIFVEKGFDILHPKYLDISNVQTGKDNPQGYRFVEFPLYNIFQAAGFKFIRIFTLEEWGRIVTIVSSLFSGIFLYLFSKKHFGFVTALFTLIFYMVIPFSIYYGRTILPDTTMMMASLGGIYFFDIYIKKKGNSKYYFLFLSTVLTAASLLLKPYAVFFALPQIILAVDKYKYRALSRIDLWIHLFISVVPLVLWRIWMLQFPEGIPFSLWLLNENGIRFRPSFFRWIFYERITKLISGYVGIVFVFFGFLEIKKIKNFLLPLSFFASSLLYIVIFATGNVQHDYYQILIIPSIALFGGLGAFHIYSKGQVWRIMGVIVFLLSMYLGWNQVKDFFNINNPALVVAGKKADEILPKDAKVIAPYGGDTTLLYYINRPGWPSFESDVKHLKKLGATHMVIVKPNESDKNGFGKMYTIIAQSSDYLILKL